jgi:class 3 adenylate cyclase
MRGLSLSARILAALVGVVLLVVAVMLLMVQRETRGQVGLAMGRAAEATDRVFREVEDLQRTQLARVGRAFATSQRIIAALEAAHEADDPVWLVETARYELELAGIPDGLVAFTDAGGTAIVSIVSDRASAGDAADIAPLAASALHNGGVVTGYRLVDGRIFTVQVEPLEIGARPVGAVAFGLPLDPGVSDRLAAASGAEVCLAAEGRCIDGTPAARSTLAPLLARSAADLGFVEVDGRRWAVWSEVLPASGTPGLARAVALPIDTVVAPFDRIRRALIWTAIAALGLAVLAGALISRRLTRPVRALVAATQRVAHGDLDARVAVIGRDELGTLAGAFNAMTEGLALKERIRSVLDKVVSRQVAEDLLARELRLGGETREVATLFADIVGFTSLTEGMDPARVIALLNECMGALGECVDAEGGIVDKYLGDGVMAIFGAPVSHGDDALRAVRAARRMREAMRRLNDRRAARAEAPIGLAIGIHTGAVVAGTLGSPDRMNYTVLGEAVNLAARLCGAAGADEILISEATARRVSGSVRAEPRGAVELRGFSRPVRVLAVRDDEGPGTAPALAASAGATGRPRDGGALALLLLALTGAPPGLAQDRPPGLPTLSGLGLGWASPNGTVQLDLSGRLDVEGYLPQESAPWLIGETDPFVAGRARVFADLFVGGTLYGLVELRADRGETPRAGRLDARVEQAFLRLRPLRSTTVHVQAGKFAMPFGGYAQRHHTAADPLVRPPLAFEYRTLATADRIPGGAQGFLNWKNETTERRPIGAPQVWNVGYPWGAVITGAAGRVGAHAGALSAAPSSPPRAWRLDRERLERPTLVAGASLRIVPELRIAASYARGPFLEPDATGPLPAGTGPRDFDQEAAGLETVFSRGHVTLRGELFVNRWEVPNVAPDPRDVSFYVEAAVRVATGLTLAGRWNELRFNRLPGAGGADALWDFDVRRIQLGAGYRLLHNAGIKVEHGLTRTLGTRDPRDDLTSIQLWWAF